jgi:DNA-binding transcriptional MerR regulator
MKIETYHSISFKGGVMPREIDGKRYYEATEVCKKVGISRPTLFRWLKRGLLINLHRDRRGWRLFTEEDLKKIQAEATRIEIDQVLVNSRDKVV